MNSIGRLTEFVKIIYLKYNRGKGTGKAVERITFEVEGTKKTKSNRKEPTEK
jgi:hypothetical protein